MTSLKVFIIARAIALIPTILILVTLVFFIMRVLPGDPVIAIVGMKAPMERVVELKKELGLIDENGNEIPLIVQYVNYLMKLVQGDLGRSLIWGKRPVVVEIMEHLPATIELAIAGFLVSLLIGMTLGTIGAGIGGKVNSAVRVYSAVAYALFIPWIGMMLQLVFSVGLKIFPVGGRIGVGLEPPTYTGLYILDSLISGKIDSFISSLKHITLPAVTLGLVISGVFSRVTRVSVEEILKQDFVVAARARGLPEYRIMLHVLKNSFIPILTMMGLQLALLMTGAVLTETTFSWPGMGTFLLERIQYRDYTTVQGTVIFFAIIVSVMNLIVDVCYAYIDPRIRY
ncbi:MAG: ABC transporter permease [Nitrososphaerota archaeon]|nr:ABC transporter permease [Candidatus Geocrenenecus dongiae]